MRFSKLAAQGQRFPIGVFRPLKEEETPISLFEGNFFSHPYSFLLESGNIHPKTARYSFMGTASRVFLSKGFDIEELSLSSGESNKYTHHPLTALRRYLPSPPFIRKEEDLPPLTGGAIGWFSYDLVRLFERLPQLAEDDLKVPDILLAFTDEILTIDHLKGRLWLTQWVDSETPYDIAMAQLKNRLDQLGNSLPTRVTPIKDKLEINYSFTKEGFEAAVKKTKEYIEAGDIFQLNLSLRMEGTLKIHPWLIYKTLREINPSPFMGYLNFSKFQVVCGSPERLVKMEKGILETRPIAGTRRKGKDNEDELAMERELVENAKERAEHIMLVDLERNDLGKVCQYGSVKVDELLSIEKYSHVMHLVSNVSGQLHPRYDQLSILKAMFPGGTITGCPKVRCMQIIEELEPVRRGLYTGSIGYLDYSGNMDLNIVIRSLFCVKSKHGHKGYLQVGAGIVADSIPEREYQESLNKAQAVLKAINIAMGNNT